MANKRISPEKKKVQVQIGLEKYKVDAIGLDKAQEEAREHLEKVYKRTIRKKE